MATPAPRNRLARETSAYLLQHAGNPVDWYPWGDEALERARSLDRPILLSIGYSACHWCHVMERESFEDPDIAALMNEHFVCIKVDREERPDVDHLYMKALQGMTGRGGWPMTMFLTPDARPFYAGTYFPPEDRGGMPGFPRVLLGVAKTWKERPGEVNQSAGKVLAFLAEDGADATPGGLDETALEEACDSLVAAMDAEHGGFGRAPKFPGTMALGLLMEAERVRTVPARRALLERTLDRMAAGGIRDHLGGGFHRYSVDRVWLVPHFEKMLYDQALLAGLYTDAFRFFGDQAWAVVSREILDYVVAEMTSADGGFFAAQDADSEGEEGRFFVWSREEILDVLGEDRGSRFCETYGVREGGNFEGRSILHRPAGDDGGLILGGRAGLGEDAGLAEDRRKLLARRRLRVAPDTDRKILTDWNGLMISAMARGGQALERPDFVDAAARAVGFVRRHLQDSTGLLHVYADGKAKVPAFLDDHAFFGRACLDLHAVRPEGDFLDAALQCAGELLEGFVDEAGGFCFTGIRGESLVARTSDLYDGPVPAGNSVAAELMLRLWSLTGNDDFRRAGQAVLDRFLGDALRNPYGGCHLIAVADRHRRGWRTVVVLGEDQARESLARTARQVYDPACTVLSIGRAEEASRIPVLSGKTAPARGAAAYLCEGSTCSLPLTSPSELRDALEDGLAAGPAAGENSR